MRFVWLFALACACATQSQEIEAVLAQHKQHDRFIDPPESLVVPNWDVGQWTLYKLSTGGHVGYVKHGIVDWTKCGVWFETMVVLSDYDSRTTFKVCFRKPPDSRVDIATQADLIEAYMVRRAGRITAVDLGTAKKRKKYLDTVLSMLESWPILAPQRGIDESRHELDIRAGQFAGVHDVSARIHQGGKTLAVVMSFHTAVPLAGVLDAKATDEDDDVVMKMELLDYGMTGASSDLPDFDAYARDVGLD